MYLDSDLILTEVAQGTFRETHLGLVHLTAGGGDRVGNIAGTHGSEQLALFTGIGGDRDQPERVDLFGAGFGLRERLGRGGLQLGAARLELGNAALSGGYRLALGAQVIAAESGLHVHLVSQLAQVADIFQQNDFHLTFLSMGSRLPLH